MKSAQRKNYCFIDGQNLYRGTQKASPSWEFDKTKLRVYLRDKYQVEKAYYFVGARQKEHRGLYKALQKAGFVVIYRPYSEQMVSPKKGNVDVDIVLEVMKKLLDEPDKFEKIILISGDGDFKRLVDYLIAKDRFEIIMFPCRERASALYRGLKFNQIENLSDPTVRKKIAVQ